MQKLFDAAAQREFKGVSTYETQESGHGRRDHRIVHAVRIPRDHAQRENRCGLNTLLPVTPADPSKATNIGRRGSISVLMSPGATAGRVGPSALVNWKLAASRSGCDIRRRQPSPVAPSWSRQPYRCAASCSQRPATGKSHQRGAKCKRFTCAIDSDYLNKGPRITQNSSGLMRKPWF